MYVLGVEGVVLTGAIWFAAALTATEQKAASEIGVTGSDSRNGGLLSESTLFRSG